MNREPVVLATTLLNVGPLCPSYDPETQVPPLFKK